MVNRRYRGILFDLDGTLVDTLELILASYRHTMARHLGQVLPDEAWLQTMGKPLKVQLADFARTPDELEAMFSTYVRHNEENQASLIRSFPGMREAIEALCDAGYRMAVVTSKIREHALRELRSCGLDRFFSGMVAAAEAKRPKPHPDPILAGLRAIAIPAREALLVGDSFYDLAAGRAAGVDTAAALWGPFDREILAPGEPRYWLGTVTDLLKLLDVEPEE